MLVVASVVVLGVVDGALFKVFDACLQVVLRFDQLLIGLVTVLVHHLAQLVDISPQSCLCLFVIVMEALEFTQSIKYFRHISTVGIKLLLHFARVFSILLIEGLVLLFKVLSRLIQLLVDALALSRKLRRLLPEIVYVGFTVADTFLCF